jgi:peptidyl-tRNA hydrolase
LVVALYAMYYKDFDVLTFLFLLIFTILYAVSNYTTIVMKDIEFDETNLYIREKRGEISVVPIRNIESIKRFLGSYYRIRFDKTAQYRKKSVYFFYTFVLDIFEKEEVKELKKLMKHVKTN